MGASKLRMPLGISVRNSHTHNQASPSKLAQPHPLLQMCILNPTSLLRDVCSQPYTDLMPGVFRLPRPNAASCFFSSSVCNKSCYLLSLLNYHLPSDHAGVHSAICCCGHTTNITLSKLSHCPYASHGACHAIRVRHCICTWYLTNISPQSHRSSHTPDTHVQSLPIFIPARTMNHRLLSRRHYPLHRQP